MVVSDHQLAHLTSSQALKIAHLTIAGKSYIPQFPLATYRNNP